jgi:hypothetical protein
MSSGGYSREICARTARSAYRWQNLPIAVAKALQIEHEREAAVATLWRALAIGDERRSTGRDVGFAESGRARIAKLVIRV